MSDEILDDFLRKLRETGETTGVPGPFDRAISSENPDLAQNLNIGRVAERAKAGIIDARGREQEVGGKVYTNPERSEYIPYYKDATDALINPTALNVAGEAAPYYGTIAAGALIPGGLFAELGTMGSAALGAQATGQAVGQAVGFLGGSAIGGAGIAAGLDKFNLGPTAYENLTQPGALALTQTGVGLATFRPGLPPGGLTAAQLRGAGIFSGVVAAEEVARAGVNTAMGTEERSPGRILADTVLHSGEAFAFGSLMKPTGLGAGLIGMGHRMAGAGNVVPSMVASGVFKVGEMPTDMPKGGKFVRNNTQGRGGVMRGPDGKLIAVDESELAASVPGSDVPSVRTEAGAPRTPKPSPTGRGDATIFDPATGAGLRITVTPDGNVQYTMFTNLGGAALKAKGPYKDLPNVFNVDQNAQIKLNFEARMADYEARRRAAEQAAAANAPVDVTATTPGPDPQLGNRTPVVPEPPRPVTPNTPPPAVTPAEAVAGGTSGTNVDPLLRTAQSRHDAAQEAERQAGRNLTKAGEDYAQAIRDEAENPGTESRQRRIDANQREKDALIALEKAQMEAEAASKNLAETKKGLEEAAAQREADKEKVEPRPDIVKNYEGWAEWGRKYEFTNDPKTGRKLTPEESAKAREDHEAYVELARARNEFDNANPGNKDLPEEQRRVYPRESLKTELAKQKWDIAYGRKYNPDGTLKAETPAQAVVTPPAENKPPEPKPTTPVASTPVTTTEPPPTQEGQTAVVVETGETVTLPSGTEKKELPMPTDKKSIDTYNSAFSEPILSAIKDKDGNDITVSSLDLQSAESLYKKEVKRIGESFGKNENGEYSFKPDYVLHVSNARKLKAHIDKLKSGETRTIQPSAERPPDLRQFKPATREEILAGTRPINEALPDVVSTLSSEDRKTYIANRKKFMAEQDKPKFDIPPPVAESPKPVVTEKSEPVDVGETVIEPTSTTAAATEAPITTSSPVDPPAVAAAKIDDEIEKLIITGDPMTATDVQKKVIATLEGLLEHSRTVEKDFKPREYNVTTERTKAYQSTIIVKANGKEVATITKKFAGKGARKAVVSTSTTQYGRSLGVIDGSSQVSPDAREITLKEEENAMASINDSIKKFSKRNDPRKYIIKISGGVTFSVPQNPEAVERLIQQVKSKGASIWQGTTGRRPAKPKKQDTQLRGPRFNPNITAKEAEDLRAELVKDILNASTLPEAEFKEEMKNIEAIRALIGGKPSQLEIVASWARTIAVAQRGEPESAMVSAQRVLKGGEVSKLIEHSGDLLHRIYERNAQGNLPYGQGEEASYGYETVKHKISLISKYLESVSSVDAFWRAEIQGFGETVPSDQEWEAHKKKVTDALKLFAQKHSELPAENQIQKVIQALNVALGNLDFTEAKTQIYRLHPALRNKKTWDKYVEQVGNSEDARNLTPEEHWDVERDREEAAKEVRTPRATEAPESAKPKAQVDAENKVEGAKRYGASGVRFNIGGPKNPDSFGGEIRGVKGVQVKTTAENWSPKDLQLIKDYLSEGAAVLRNLGYPKFYFNTHISGADSNWVSAAVPAAGGNFVVYEINPKGDAATGNSYNRTVRLFRRLVNSEGKQIGSMTEVSAGELKGMSTISLAEDGKPLFQVPAIFHAMMRAAQDSLSAREMTEGQVNYSGDATNPNPSNVRIPISGTINEDLKSFEENELSPPGLRDKMEVFNGLKNGEGINRAIINFIGAPDSTSGQALIAQLRTTALMSAVDAESFLAEIAQHMGMDPENLALVTSARGDELYPIIKKTEIYPTEARLMLKWINNGYQRIIFEIGKHDPDTGMELPDKIPMLMPNGDIRYSPKLGPNGEKVPMTRANPRKWNAPMIQWMTAEDFTVRDKDGKVTFMPAPHQVVGPNMAMTRWFPPGVESAPRDLNSGQPRAILINDAPGTGKTIQMLLAAVLYRKHMAKLVADPSSKWYGMKLQPVLIVTQNAQIIQNAFRGDSRMAGIELNGKFTEEGFEPDEYEDTPNGRILKGNSWIDFATYSSIKPQMERAMEFENDGKTPKMVDRIVRDEEGEPVLGPDGKEQIMYSPTEVDAKGMPVPLKEQAFKMIPIGPPKKGSGKWGVVMFDESHNMKNDTSARSDAGFEIMSQSQHVLLASGTPIDKPTQLGPLLSMLLDRPLPEIAKQIGMNVSIAKRDQDLLRRRRVEGAAVITEKPRLEMGAIPIGAEEREKLFKQLFAQLSGVRDEAGRAGAILRRSTKYFGIENIWLDPSDSFHPEGKKLLMRCQSWWFNEMEAASEGGGVTGWNAMTLRGMMLFESKRLASLVKCGIPGTPWNPSEEPRGAAKIMLEELAEGRKVIITMDTSNQYGLEDAANIRKFMGLDHMPYESEAKLWTKYLESKGIKFGTITGDFSIAQREYTIREFQKNNPDLQVIIMTTQSGGTGLSIDDRHGVGGKAKENVNRKTYTDAEIAKMTQMAAEEIPGEKIDSGSLPRTIIIVSSPWGGDVFIQAMGRTDRMLSTTPSRIIVLTAGIADGDQKLQDLVRRKISATQAINEERDELAGGIRAEMDEAAGGAGPSPEGKTISLSDDDKSYYLGKATSMLRVNRNHAKDVLQENKERIANGKKNNATNRDLRRWEKTVEVAEEYITYVSTVLNKIDLSLSASAELKKKKQSELFGDMWWMDVINKEKEYKFEAFKKKKEGKDTEEESEDDDNETLDEAFNIGESRPYDDPGGSLERKGQDSKRRKVVDALYEFHNVIRRSNIPPDKLAEIERTMLDIVYPFTQMSDKVKLSNPQLVAILRMARDVSHLLHTHEIVIREGDENTGYAGRYSQSGAAILQVVKDWSMESKRTTTLYHEIGHSMWQFLSDEQRAEVIKEFNMARAQWIAELPEGNPMKSVVLPVGDMRIFEGAHNYEVYGKVKNAPAIAYGRKREYMQGYSRPKPESGLSGTDDLAVGAMLVGRASAIAFKNAKEAGWLGQSDQMPMVAMNTKLTRLAGERGQGDIVEHGSTPEERATKALASIFVLRILGNTKASIDSLKLAFVDAQIRGMGTNTGGSGQIDFNELLGHLDGGWGIMDVKPNGDLVLSTMANVMISSNGNYKASTLQRPRYNLREEGKSNPLELVEITISGKNFYTSFMKAFGNRGVLSQNAQKIFAKPAVASLEFTQQANSLQQVINGQATKMGGTAGQNYRYINPDEWMAMNGEELFTDYYELNDHSDPLTQLYGGITSSIFVNASTGGFGSVAKSLIAGLVEGTILPAQIPDPMAHNMGASDWMSQRFARENAATRTNAPPEGEMDTGEADLDELRGIQQSAVRKLESGIEALNALAASAAESALEIDLIPDRSSMAKWLESVKRRKQRTGQPDQLTGFGPAYYAAHTFGTMIGQLEQIAQMSKDPYVAELVKRLYPSTNTGLNVRTTYAEDVYAHTAFWTNRFDRTLRENIGKKLGEATKDKIRTIRDGAENEPGFHAAFTQYLLKVHSATYNTIERMIFEFEALDKDEKGFPKITKSLRDEMNAMNFTSVDDMRDELKNLEMMASADALSFRQGGRYDKLALGREADWFLSEFMEGDEIDKIMMDIGRCQAISPDSPEYADRAKRFSPEVVATAEAMISSWSQPYLKWARSNGGTLADWGTSFVPRIADSGIISSYGSGAGDDFIVTAAKAFMEDNKFQRVRLPYVFKDLVTDYTVSKIFVNEGMQPHVTASEIIEKMQEMTDPDTGADLLEDKYPEWMSRRIEEIFNGFRDTGEFLGYDIPARTSVPGKDVEDIDPVTGVATPRTQNTTIGHHISANLQIYKQLIKRYAISTYGSMTAAMKIKSVRDEIEMIDIVVSELADSHQRKVLSPPLTQKDAIKIAKKWRERIDLRSSGIESSSEGYADLFAGQHGTMKKPDSMKQRQMDTSAADRILERFYVRDPRIFGPAYNESVTRNLMVKKHIPEALYEQMKKSIISNPQNRRFWPEIAFVLGRITEANKQHDANVVWKSMVTLAAGVTFMPVTAALQLTEPMPTGLHMQRPSSGGYLGELASMTAPGVTATADTIRIGATRAMNAGTKSMVEILSIGKLNQNFELMSPRVDEFMTRLAERSGIIMSSLMDDLPQSSADPRSGLQRFTEKMVHRYHNSGNALATVTNISRVAVLKRHVIMLETTADEILLRETARYGLAGAKDAQLFAALLKPNEILLFRNLGVPDIMLKKFMKHALMTRPMTEGGWKLGSIPKDQISDLLKDLIDSGYTENNAVAAIYSNALNRLNMLTIQRSVPANQSRLRGVVSRHFGETAGSLAMFLTNFSSAFGRNVILPAGRMVGNSMTRERFVARYGMQERGPTGGPAQPRGTYLTKVGYPISPNDAVFRKLPAIALMVAATTAMNYGTREMRRTMRADGNSTYVDQRSIPMKVFAAIDQAGFTGNLSMPINVINALRYQREAAQVASGPFLGGLAGLVDAARTLVSDQNSENTPTAERAFAKILYDMALRPIAQTGLQMLTPNSTVGDMVNFAGAQAMAMPAVREAFMRWTAHEMFNAGNEGKRVPPTRADLMKAYELKLITIEQLSAGLQERYEYDSFAKLEKANREAYEADKRRKELEGK